MTGLEIAKLHQSLERARESLREKNDIIKAYAGPTGMTPEDVAYALEEYRLLREEVHRLLRVISPYKWRRLIDWQTSDREASRYPAVIRELEARQE